MKSIDLRSVRGVSYPHMPYPLPRASGTESLCPECGMIWLTTLLRLVFWWRVFVLARRVWRWIRS